MEPFTAFRIHQDNDEIVARLEQISLDDLSAGDVVIRTSWSGINYKDALAATGAGKILRHYPLVGGIDVAGVVISSEDDRFGAGDEVLVVGAGLSETRDGGYAEFGRFPADLVIPCPQVSACVRPWSSVPPVFPPVSPCTVWSKMASIPTSARSP